MPLLIDILWASATDKGTAALDAVVAALLEIIQQETVEANRVTAIETLGRLAEKGHSAALGGILLGLNDPVPAVRLHAAQSLQFVDLATVNKSLRQQAQTSLNNLLHDRDNYVQLETLRALVYHKMIDHFHLDHLLSLLHHTDPTVRQYAVLALGSLNDPSIVPHLIERLDDPDSRVCLKAAEMLGTNGDERAIDPLFAIASNDTNYYGLRDSAVDALARIDRPRVTALLFELLRHTDFSLRANTIRAIRAIESVEHVQLLLDVADSHSSLVRPVRNTLIRAHSDAVEQVMIDHLAHVREWMRRLAVAVLGEMQSHNAVPALAEVLLNDEPELRVLAANALGQIAHPQAIRGLIRALQDNEWRVEMAAVSALEQINTPEARAAASRWRDGQNHNLPQISLDDDMPDIDLSDLSGDLGD